MNQAIRNIFLVSFPQAPALNLEEPRMPKSRTKLAAVWPPTACAAREGGHKPQSPLQAIREICRECSCYQLNEIRLCEAVNCALWPFRAGKHPWRAEARKTPLTDANVEAQTASGDEGLSSC